MIKHHFFRTFNEQQVVIEMPGEELISLPGDRYWEEVGIGAGLDLETRLAASPHGTRIAELPKEDFGLPIRADTPVWGACPPTATNKSRAAERNIEIVPPGGFYKCSGKDVIRHSGTMKVIRGIFNNFEDELVALATGRMNPNGAEILGYAQGIDAAKSKMSHERGKLTPPGDFASLMCWKELCAIGHVLIRPRAEETLLPGNFVMQMVTPESWQDEISANPWNQDKLISDYGKNGPIIAGHNVVGSNIFGLRAIMLGMGLTKNVAAGKIDCSNDEVRCSLTEGGELVVKLAERVLISDELEFLRNHGTYMPE